MRLVLQRALSGSVEVDGEVVGKIGKGLVVLCGISEDDDDAAADWACRKLLNTRLWESDDGKAWARSVGQAKLGVLLISQFTLHAQLKGNKPDFHRALGPDKARPFWESFVARVKKAHAGPVETGIFGAKMAVSLVNDGPVTIILDSTETSSGGNKLPVAAAPPSPPKSPTKDASTNAPPPPPPPEVKEPPDETRAGRRGLGPIYETVAVAGATGVLVGLGVATVAIRILHGRRSSSAV